jgi:hypothetical protein
MIDIEPTLIIALFSIGISSAFSIFFLYFLHLQGPKFKLIPLKPTDQRELDVRKVSLFIAFINQGNKTGLIEKIYCEPHHGDNPHITLEMKKKEGDNFDRIDTPLWVHKKDALMLRIEYSFIYEEEIPNHVLKADVWEHSYLKMNKKSKIIGKFEKGEFKKLCGKEKRKLRDI